MKKLYVLASALVIVGTLLFAAEVMADTLRGTAGDDVLIGSTEDDLLKGRGGDDTIKGRAGDDRIYPGPGADL